MTAGCGMVSDSSLPPRREGLFKAESTQFDGRSTPLNGINRVHVASGRHVLTVGELIPSHRLSMTQNLQRSRAKQHLMARAYKPLVVDVQPGTEYRIGVRLRKDRLDYASIRRSEEHTSEIQSLMRISYAVICLKNKKNNKKNT